jgi:hypothetical protein
MIKRLPSPANTIYQSPRLKQAQSSSSKCQQSGLNSQTVTKAQIHLILILLTQTIWRAPNNASKWQMGFHSVFKGVNTEFKINQITLKPTHPSPAMRVTVLHYHMKSVSQLFIWE